MDADHAAAVARVRGWPKAKARKANLALLTAPPLFDIEIASACNVVCTFCPREEMVRSKKLMDEETFSAVSGFMPHHAVAMLSGLGDALLHPRLARMVRQLVARGVSTCLITNGVRLTPRRQDELVEAGLSEIQVSVHGMTDPVVRRIVPFGADPTAVRTNLDRLAHVARERGGPRLRINFVETPENVQERPSVQAWAESLGARFFHRALHTRGGTIGAADVVSGDGCGIFAGVTFISADGDLMPCVNDVRGEGRFGHVRDHTWADVLAWKRSVIAEDRWFRACSGCNDEYRWVLLEGAPTSR